MPQQEQQVFMESLEGALSWMQSTQERLRANDNTQGPRDALEKRLRETEKIHHSEHEGRMKMDKAMVAAEHLLQSEDEELRNHTLCKLRELKTQWEETTTYIIHCHSRIEWVWLHWSEYLKAYEEFELWLTRQQRALALGVELQVGLKEKLWQVDQQRVVLSDVQSQAGLLERLLDEAGSLYTRTQDPSVDQQAQERMQADYNDVRDKAEERLSLLKKIAEEHQTYQGCVERFQSWLMSKTRELMEMMEKDDPAEKKLQALKALDDSVASEEKTLLHIEGLAEGVRANTSPAGAEQVVEEAEELRLGWQRLRQALCEAEEGLRVSLDSHQQYMSRCHRLGEDITRLRQLLLSLEKELEGEREAGESTARSEEQMVGQWRTYTGVKNTLAGEECQVEHLKAQLKELFRFSEDSRHLSDDVLAVVKEHQSVKCRATRLCSESECGLRSALQDPLLAYSQWCLQVSQVLEAEVTDFSHIAMLVQKIERLLVDSAELQERLGQLQVKGDLLDSVFGRDRADTLQTELSAAVRNRELLHSQLLQRKSRLQGLISRTKDFSDAHELTGVRLGGLRDRLAAADSLQPDILAKKSQADQFRAIQKDLEDCEAHIAAMETLVSSSPANKTQFERLYAEWKNLYAVVMMKVRDSEENIAEHESFHDDLLNLEKWIMIMRQKLESFHSSSGECSVEGRQQEAEKVLDEFPEKEFQLQKLEVRGRSVLDKTSDEGRVHIQRDMERLRASWMSLYDMTLNLDGLLKFSMEQTEADSWKLRDISTADISVSENTKINTGSSSSPTGQTEKRSGDVYRELPLPGPEGSLEVDFEEDDIIDQSSWLEGQPWGHFVASSENKKGAGLSCSDGTDSGPSWRDDETDSPAWILRKRKDQSGAKDVIVDGEAGIDNLKMGDSRSGRSRVGVLSVMESTMTMRTDEEKKEVEEEGGQRYREGSTEAADSLSYGGGRRAGAGAFVQFKRSTSTQESQRSSASFDRTGQQGMMEMTRATRNIQQTDGAGTQTLSDEETGGGRERYRLRWREFEEWLRKENAVLSEVLASYSGPLSAQEIKVNQAKLRALRNNVPYGQELFQELRVSFEDQDDPQMEELRYRWILYKSKLKDINAEKASAAKFKIPPRSKPQKKPSLLYRVCCLALPLWLLLLALLLLAFLLPLPEDSNSCSLSNNFARSFNIMLRYQGPPPT
ncbi:LOW QUALITY PROTEIN: nesprin-3 [Boleophthalmus pectinirostris]|uniref:LOW QUALITY PROTEIN: nesprin-3 n=1 Tax=Boleophthalmus pectinirostris TaxID=150288 RepID=UPI00242FA0EC|nr:LOW QUALITY PROTEIN: nesprin-3 [Boleophthalmus pectinirostris]